MSVDPELNAPPPTAHRRGRVVLGGAVTVVVIVAAVAVGAWLAGDEEPSSRSEEPSSDAQDDPKSEAPVEDPPTVAQAERAEILQFAADASVAMFAHDHDTYDKSVADAQKLMTGSFAAEYRFTTDAVRDEFLAARTTVDVKIPGTGAISVDGDVADVLVFANHNVERGGETTYTPYQIVLSLVRDGDGWLVDAVTREDPDPRPEPDPGQAAILEAARQMALAFMNIDYRTIADDLDEVLALATGKFAREYEDASQDLQTLAVRARAIQQAEIFAAGISRSDEASATVIVGTQGTVSNEALGDEPSDRADRLKLGLMLVEGEWRTAELDYVR